jgi:raffinose/stachyose/melibiose transport system substrate-binding protein
MGKRLTAFLALSFSVVLSACSSGGATPTAGAPSAPASEPASAAPPSAAAVACDKLVVLNHRTDLAESGAFDKLYVGPFKAKYPGVKDVSVESIRDYHTDVKTRMNTEEYGDVLVIPNGVTLDQLSTFFEPLGKQADLASKYRYLNEGSFDGTTYGIAINGNAQGFVYNKKVFAAAGITAWPKTPDEFIADLKAIKDKTAAIPLYTNYKAGWPMSQWEGHVGEITNDPDAGNKLAHDAAPWSPGKDLYVIDKLLYDVVHDKLNEADPTTTDWEPSKQLIADGKIGTMVLGSWAISQMQGKATDPADIGYLPFPNQVGGTFYSTTGGDLKMAINVHSKCKEAARAWLDWFTGDSNYASNESGIPTLLTGSAPAWLDEFQKAGVKLIELNQAPKGEEGLTDNIAKEAEIDIWGNVYRQALVDAARGQVDKSFDAIIKDLNTKWAAAKTKLGG